MRFLVIFKEVLQAINGPNALTKILERCQPNLGERNAYTN